MASVERKDETIVLCTIETINTCWYEKKYERIGPIIGFAKVDLFQRLSRIENQNVIHHHNRHHHLRCSCNIIVLEAYNKCKSID